MMIRTLAAAALCCLAASGPLHAQSHVISTIPDFRRGHLENLQIRVTGDGAIALVPRAVPTAWLGSQQGIEKLPVPLSRHGMVVSGGFVYVIGGQSVAMGAYLPTVYMATLNENGVPGGWVPARSLPEGMGRGLHGVAEYNGFIYVVGGDAPSDNVDVRPEVFYTRVLENGELDEWKTTTELPADTALGVSGGRDLAGVTAYRGHLYVIGGATQEVFAGTPVALSAPINADGTLGAWRSSPLPTAAARLGAPALAAAGRIYYPGGEQIESPVRTILADVWRGEIAADGTLPDWLQLPTSMPGARSNSFTSGVSAAGSLFVLGGSAPTPDGGFARSASVFVGELDADGGIPNWVEAAALPEALLRGAAAHLQAFEPTAGALVFSGGDDQTGADSDDVYVAALVPSGETPQLAYQGTFESPFIPLNGGKVTSVSWVASGEGTVALQWRAADADGAWSPWSDPATASPVAVTLPDGATAFQYLLTLTGNGTTSPVVESITAQLNGGTGGEIPGDLDGNGVVSIVDVVFGLRVVASLTPLTPEQQARLVRVGDTAPAGSHDGRFDIRDVIRLLRFVARLEPNFPN